MTAHIHQEEQSLAAKKTAQNSDALAEARRRRLDTLKRIAGIWANRTDIPDGLEYQRKLRDEWR
jgi:hypothetical protein